MTLKQAKAILKTYGLSISKRDGEYRVSNPSMDWKRREDCAYYTNDITDAVNTAEQMAKQNRM